MRFLQIDHDHYPRSHKPIANLIRIGFIICKNIVSVGFSTELMIHRDSMERDTLESQIIILINSDNVEKEDKKCLEIYLKLNKSFKKIKRPDKETIVNLRRAETYARIFAKEWYEKNEVYLNNSCLCELHKTLTKESCKFYIPYSSYAIEYSQLGHTIPFIVFSS